MSLSELKESWLEATLAAEKNLPLIVVDFKVYAHSVLSYLESAVDIVGDDESKLRAVVRALWAYKLNRGIDSLPPRDFTAIVVNDFKGPLKSGGIGYWRSLEAEELGMPEYKGGRPSKPSLFPLVLEEGLKYVKDPGSKFHFFEKEWYEADDIAGKIARIQRTDPALDRYVLLSTLDGDWQGLVSDAHKIVWCNTGPWLPRIRTEAEVCDYYLRKEGLHIKTARDTYTVKVEVGDRGDNLLPGTPLRFFDLYEEDEVWNFSSEEEDTLRAIISDTSQSNRPDHLTNAKRFLAAIGMPVPEIPAPAPSDVVAFSEKARKERRQAHNPGLKGTQKKYCIDIRSDAEFEKCVRVVMADNEARERIKEIEDERKCGEAKDPEARNLLKALREERKDHKAILLRFGAKLDPEDPRT